MLKTILPSLPRAVTTTKAVAAAAATTTTSTDLWQRPCDGWRQLLVCKAGECPTRLN